MLQSSINSFGLIGLATLLAFLGIAVTSLLGSFLSRKIAPTLPIQLNGGDDDEPVIPDRPYP